MDIRFKKTEKKLTVFKIGQSWITTLHKFLFNCIGIKLFSALILLIPHTFAQVNADIQKTFTIDVSRLPQNDNVINLSGFASEITYLPLETRDEYLINQNARFYLFDSIIVCCSNHQLLVFNAENGKFIHSVGEYGKGPNGFMNSMNSYVRNEKVIIAALGWDNSLIEYDINGKILAKIQVDGNPCDITWVNDNLYAFHYHKNSNQDTLRLQIYDRKKDKILASFFDFRKFKDTNRFTFYKTSYYRFKDTLFFKEFFNDTIFQVASENLVPKVIFNSGKYSPPFYEKDRIAPSDYFYFNFILETGGRIFFRLNFNKKHFYCYFDKLKNEVHIPNDKDTKVNGYYDDINGFMPFYPLTLSNHNKLIGYLEPYKIKQWFKNNPDKAAKLPSHVQKLRNIKETDNPVVMIVKLKE
jgi:hypothetical protein